jgi:hypothetical protein
MNRKTKLIQAAIALAERSQSLTQQSKLQSDISWGEKLFARAVRQQRASFRLMKLAGVGS